MKVAIASDHAGFQLKEAVKEHFSDFEWLDLGPENDESVNYADYGFAIAKAVAEGDAAWGIAICGSGIGISIAANRNAKIRAALCTSNEMARLSRQHNNANILAIGARIVEKDTAFDMIQTFFDTGYEGGRHDLRVNTLAQVFE
jgi:ribose 5-phosphate isomerase B